LAAAELTVTDALPVMEPGDRIGGGDGLAAGGLEDDPGEGVHAASADVKCSCWQDRRRIGAGEVDCAQVTRERVVLTSWAVTVTLKDEPACRAGRALIFR